MVMELIKDKNRAREIEKAIQSTDSPVGIDAKHTHVIIIEKLMDIQNRLEQLEAKLGK